MIHFIRQVFFWYRHFFKIFWPFLKEFNEIIYTSDHIPKENTSKINSHAEHPLIEFDSEFPECVFLKGDLALLEQELCLKAQNVLSEDNFAEPLSSPDIVRSTVLEGCDPRAFGKPFSALALNKSSDFGDIHSGLGAHLVGSASFPSMTTNFIKNVSRTSKCLPYNYFTIGRQYKFLGTNHLLFFDSIRSPSRYYINIQFPSFSSCLFTTILTWQGVPVQVPDGSVYQ